MYTWAKSGWECVFYLDIYKVCFNIAHTSLQMFAIYKHWSPHYVEFGFTYDHTLTYLKNVPE